MSPFATFRRIAALIAVSALPHLAAAAAPKPLVFTVLESAPYGERDAAGRAKGIYPDIVRALSAQIKLPIKIELVPFARAAYLVAAHEADATLMFKNSLLDNKAVPVLPVFSTELVVQLRPGLRAGASLQLSKLLVGRIRGGCKDLENDETRLYELNNQEQGVKMLLSRRIDGFCTTADAFRAVQLRFDRQAQINVSDRVLVGRKEVWLFVGGHVDAATAARLREGMAALQDSGALARILAQPREEGSAME